MRTSSRSRSWHGHTAHRAASTAANRRPPVLGPAVPPVGRLDGCHVAQGMREKRLADPDGADDGDVVMALQEAERREFVEEGAIEGHLQSCPSVRAGPRDRGNHHGHAAGIYRKLRITDLKVGVFVDVSRRAPPCISITGCPVSTSNHPEIERG
jgi:hypothetical protein